MKKAGFQDNHFIIGFVITMATQNGLKWQFLPYHKQDELYLNVFYPEHLEEEVYSWYAQAEESYRKQKPMIDKMMKDPDNANEILLSEYFKNRSN